MWRRDLCDSASDWLPPENLWTQNSLGKSVATAEVLNVVRHVIQRDFRKFWVGNLSIWKPRQTSPMSQITSGNYWEALWSTITVKKTKKQSISFKPLRVLTRTTQPMMGMRNRQGRASENSNWWMWVYLSRTSSCTCKYTFTWFRNSKTEPENTQSTRNPPEPEQHLKELFNIQRVQLVVESLMRRLTANPRDSRRFGSEPASSSGNSHCDPDLVYLAAVLVMTDE